MGYRNEYQSGQDRYFKECVRKFEAQLPSMDDICKQCGERYGEHQGVECPQDKQARIWRLYRQ